jgi:hypothetical protein
MESTCTGTSTHMQLSKMHQLVYTVPLNNQDACAQRLLFTNSNFVVTAIDMQTQMIEDALKIVKKNFMLLSNLTSVS